MSRLPIVVATGFLDDNWHSMRVVAEGLRDGLADAGHAATLFAPRLGKTPRWYDRRLLYGGRLPKADVIHLCDQSYGDALFKARDRAGLVAATVHDINFWRARNPVTAPFRSRIRDGLSQADALIASSHATAREMNRELGLTAARVVALGTDLTRYPHVAAARVPGQLLLVGSSTERKGVDRALRLLARLPAPFHLVKVGEAFTAEQAALISKLGIGDRITLRSGVGDGDLSSTYATATALLFPSRYEGYGLPPVEARLTGTMAFVSSAVPVREFLEKDSGTVTFAFENFDEAASEKDQRAAAETFASQIFAVTPLQDREWFGWRRAALEYHEVWSGVTARGVQAGRSR